MKNLIIITLFAGIFTLTACNDWLDVKPETQMETKELFKKENGFRDALTACYMKLNSATLYGQGMTMTNIEFLAQHWDNTTGNYKDAALLKNFDYKSSYAETTFKNIYSALYNTIAQANIVLEYLKTNGDVIKKEQNRAIIEAEALGIRAFCHLDVLRLFGQLPKNPTKKISLPYAETVSTENIPYYSYEEFKQLILKDIDQAQALLKDSDPVFKYTFSQLDKDDETDGNLDGAADLDDEFLYYRRFRFNYYALEALKARLYMYTNQPAEANKAAKNVIDAKDSKGRKMFTLGGANDFGRKYYALPSECILALSNDNLSTTSKNLFNYNGLFLTKNHYEKDLFAGQSTGVNNRALNVWNAEATNSQGTPLPLLRKYDQPSKEDNIKSRMRMVKYQVIPLLRLSEMYLIAMETSAIGEANSLYADYMAARYVGVTTLTQEEMNQEIIREYRREFFAEGQMFFTYKRLGYNKMLWKNDREISETDYLIPLPNTELKSN